jgi:hypothetical protein
MAATSALMEGTESDIASAGDVEITTGMIATGTTALAVARESDLKDESLVVAVYTAMARALSTRERGGEDLWDRFAMETIYNIRAAIEEMKCCERRTVEHFRQIAANDRGAS